MQSVAEEVIAQNGYDYSVKVMRGNFEFPKKTYHLKKQDGKPVI